jgi:hypothetical protein
MTWLKNEDDDDVCVWRGGKEVSKYIAGSCERV